MDLLQFVINLEQRGIDALFLDNIENKEWIGRGNYLKIDYKCPSGKVIDTHPHINTLIKRLAQSTLTIKRQREILEGCEHHAAEKYLECLQAHAYLDTLIDCDIPNEQFFRF